MHPPGAGTTAHTCRPRFLLDFGLPCGLPPPLSSAVLCPHIPSRHPPGQRDPLQGRRPPHCGLASPRTTAQPTLRPCFTPPAPHPMRSLRRLLSVASSGWEEPLPPPTPHVASRGSGSSALAWPGPTGTLRLGLLHPGYARESARLRPPSPLPSPGSHCSQLLREWRQLRAEPLATGQAAEHVPVASGRGPLSLVSAGLPLHPCVRTREPRARASRPSAVLPSVSSQEVSATSPTIAPASAGLSL